MDWTQFALFFIGVFSMWLWQRSESSADRRDIMTLIKAIQDEIKDFHGRLCTIEERYRQK